MKPAEYLRHLLLVLVLGLAALRAAAGVGLEAGEHGVLDRAGVLQSHVLRDAGRQLAQLEQTAGLRVAVLVVEGLPGAEAARPEDAAETLFAAWTPAGDPGRILVLIDAAGRRMAIHAGAGPQSRFSPAALAELRESLAADSLKVGDINSTVADAVKGLGRIAGQAESTAAEPGSGPPSKVERVNGLVAVPALSSPVTDLTATLTPMDKANLEQRLYALEAETGAQLAVLLVPTTAPEALEQYSLRVVEAWRLGQHKLDNGVLLLVAKDDRKLRIEVGYGLEGALNDATARRVIDERIAPRFARQDYVGGIQAGVEAMIPIIRAEPMPAGPARSQEHPFDLSTLLAFWIAVAFGLVLSLVLRQRAPAAKVAPVAAAASAVLGFVLGLFLGGPVLALLSGVVVYFAAYLATPSPEKKGAPSMPVPGLEWPRPDSWPGSGQSAGRGSGQTYSGGGGKFGGGGASGGW